MLTENMNETGVSTTSTVEESTNNVPETTTDTVVENTDVSNTTDDSTTNNDDTNSSNEELENGTTDVTDVNTDISTEEEENTEEEEEDTEDTEDTEEDSDNSGDSDDSDESDEDTSDETESDNIVLTEYPKVRTPFLQKIGGKDKQILLSTIADQVAYGPHTVAAELKILRNLIDGATTALVFKTYEEMVNLDDVPVPTIGRVIDASADPQVREGAASYIYNGDDWIFLSALDEEIVLPKWEDVQNKPLSSVDEIDEAVTERHTHDNKNILDRFSVNDEDIPTFDGNLIAGTLDENKVEEIINKKAIEGEYRDIMYLKKLPLNKPPKLRDGGLLVVGDGPIEGFSGINPTLIWTNPAPITTTLGGLNAGSNLAGKSILDILEKMLYKYQSPMFTTAYISTFNSELEVGTPVSENGVLSFTVSNPKNILPNSITLLDHLNKVVATGLGIQSPIDLTFPSWTKKTVGPSAWTLRGVNTENVTFTRGIYITWQARVYFGISELPEFTSATEILNLGQSKLQSILSTEIDFDGEGYKYVAIPIVIGIPTAITNTGRVGGTFGEEVPFIRCSDVEVTNEFGVKLTYSVWRSQETSEGPMSIRIS